MEQQTAPVKKQRILSGIQPSGTPTLGNYIGAMRNWKLLEDQYDCLYMIADLHAITVRQEPAKLRAQSIQLLALLLAIGLDPENIPAYMGRAEMNELTTANETAWADVSEAENGAVTAEALTAAAPTAEEIGAVSLSKLYVYYGSHENRSREGEGVWFILNPGKKDLTA